MSQHYTQAAFDSIEHAIGTWLKERTVDSFTCVVAAFNKVIHDAADPSYSPELRKGVIRYLPAFIACHIEMDDELDKDQTLCVLNILTQPESLEQLLAQPDGEYALAWFCCDHSMVYPYLNDAMEAEALPKFVALLNVWTGLTLPTDFYPDPEIMARLIYGDAAWSLYGESVDDPGELELVPPALAEIARLRLPLDFKQYASAITTTSERPALPDAFEL